MVQPREPDHTPIVRYSHNFILNMEQVEDIYAIQAQVTQQQSKIRELKKAGTATAQEILDEVETLNALRAKLSKCNEDKVPETPFNRKSFDELILRKMYVVPSFEIHNGPAGLFDYGVR